MSCALVQTRILKRKDNVNIINDDDGKMVSKDIENLTDGNFLILKTNKMFLNNESNGISKLAASFMQTQASSSRSRSFRLSV